MKAFHILLIATFLVFVTPIYGFCHEDECGNETQQCEMIGHISCCQNPVTLAENGQYVAPGLTSYRVASIISLYQNPHIAVQHPPPIDLA